MRNHQIVGVTAVGKNTQAAHGTAQIFLAALTWAAGAAADPRMRKPTIADFDALDVRTEGDDLANVFVTERDRKFHAAIRKAHPLAATQIEPAIGEVQIAVANAC